MAGEGTNVGRIYVSLGLKNEMGQGLASATSQLKNFDNASKNIGKNLESSLGNSLKNVSNQSSSLGSTISSNIGKAFSGIASKITSSLSGAKSAISSFASSSVSAFNSLTAAGDRVYQKMGFFGTAMAAIFSYKLKAAIQDAAEAFMSFDDQMRKVSAVTESTEKQFAELTAQAKLLGATTSFTAQEAAQAMTLLGQAGFDANETMAAMPATLNLARSSMTELATTADIMSNIMNGFRIAADDTERAADVLSKAANATNTDVTQLGQAMKYVAPLAYQVGWSLEETAAAAGLLSNAGIKSSMAGTVLRNSISRLLSPTEKSKQILQSYGITLDTISPKTHSFAQIIDILAQSGISAADIMTVFGMRAGPGILAMMNIGTGAIREMNQTLLDSAGYAQKAADMMDAGWGGTMRRFRDMIEAIQISFGQAIASVLTPFVKMITVIGVAISRLPQPILKLAAVFSIVAVAAGTLLVALAALPVVVSVLSAGWAALGTVLTGLGTAAMVITGSFSTLGAVIHLMALPISTVVAGIAGLSAGFVALGFVLYEIEKKTQVFAKTWETLKDLWTIGTYYLGKAFGELKKVVGDAIDGIMESLRQLSEDTWIGRFVDSISNAYDKISQTLGKWRADTHETAEAIRAEEAKQAESTENVQKQIENAHNGVVASYQTVDEATGETYASMIENATDAESSVTGTNDSIISSNGDLITSYDGVTTAIGGIKAAITDMSQTDISQINAGSSDLSLDSLTKGIELADGSMLTLNEDGQLVIKTLDGVITKLSEFSSASLNTASGEQLTVLGGGKGTYTSTGKPAKKISLEDAKNAEISTADRWAAETGQSVITLNPDGSIPNKNTRRTYNYSVEEANDTILSDAGRPKTKASGQTISLEESKLRGEQFSKGTRQEGSGKTALSQKYIDRLAQQKKMGETDANYEKTKKSISKALTDDVGWSGFFKSIFSGNIGTALGGSSPKEGGTFSKLWDKINYKVPGTENLTSGAFDISGILNSYDTLKGKMEEVDSFSFSGLLSSISNIGSEQDTASGKAENHKGILERLGGTSLSNLWSQITGVGSEQDTAKGKGEDHKGLLDTFNGISFSGLVGSILGVGSEQDTAKGKGEEHKGVLDLINSTSMSSLIGQIFGVGSEEDTSTTKGGFLKSALDTVNSTSMSSIIGQIFGVGSEEDTSATKGGFLKSALDTVNKTSMGSLISQIFGVGSEEVKTSGKTTTLTGYLIRAGSVSFSGTISSIKSVISTIENAISAAGRLIVKLAEAAKAKVSDYISNSSSKSSAAKASQMTASEKTTRAANNAVRNNNIKINTQNNYNSSKSTAGLL